MLPHLRDWETPTQPGLPVTGAEGGSCLPACLPVAGERRQLSSWLSQLTLRTQEELCHPEARSPFKPLELAQQLSVGLRQEAAATAPEAGVELSEIQPRLWDPDLFSPGSLGLFESLKVPEWKVCKLGTYFTVF